MGRFYQWLCQCWPVWSRFGTTWHMSTAYLHLIHTMFHIVIGNGSLVEQVWLDLKWSWGWIWNSGVGIGVEISGVGIGVGVETSGVGVGVGVDILEICRSWNWSWSWNLRSWSWSWSWYSGDWPELELELELKPLELELELILWSWPQPWWNQSDQTLVLFFIHMVIWSRMMAGMSLFKFNLQWNLFWDTFSATFLSQRSVNVETLSTAWHHCVWLIIKKKKDGLAFGSDCM